MDIKFQDSITGKTDYGWIEARGIGFVPPQFGTIPLAPTFAIDIVAYAYDASGAKIEAGQTSVPEPSQALVLAAFSALTMGAAGVRRLKALKN